MFNLSIAQAKEQRATLERVADQVHAARVERVIHARAYPHCAVEHVERGAKAELRAAGAEGEVLVVVVRVTAVPDLGRYAGGREPAAVDWHVQLRSSERDQLGSKRQLPAECGIGVHPGERSAAAKPARDLACQSRL